MTFPPLYVLRHGETEWNAQGRLQGAMNSPLTAKGRAQAADQGAVLASLELADFDIFVSPQARAFHTAAIALASRAAWLRTDPRLAEITLGDWTGRKRADIQDIGGPGQDAFGDYAFYDVAPGGEGFAGLHARCLAFLRERTRPTICVTHGITSRMLRCIALGLPITQLPNLPGGQGLVHVVEGGAARVLSP